MKRRDTEQHHAYSDEVFSFLTIHEIQGLLKEGDLYRCGVEAYQVPDFKYAQFEMLDQRKELARFEFCKQLGVPYYLILSSEATGSYEIYIAHLGNDKVEFQKQYSFSGSEFLDWWRKQQSFEQKKPMYNAGARISDSIIDKDLFGNSLAWGVNIDGFLLGRNTGSVKAIVEKRIRTYSKEHSVENYDPNSFFKGTKGRSGDFSAWMILFDLATKVNAPLIVLTFDTSSQKKIGATRIIQVTERGLAYHENVKPCQNVFSDDISGLTSWLRSVL